MWHGILGHDVVVDQFRARLAAGRLASTYLFVGPEGVGKRTLAVELAKTLLCTNADPRELTRCGACDSCRLSEGDAHPDIHLTAREPGAKFLKLEQFIGDAAHRHREGLCFELALRPLLGRRRAAIIDDADWLNVESANALLKTLEEPPPGALLILIGTSRSRQLPTILSRTQIVRFGPLELEDLATLIDREGIVPAIEEARDLAARSGGSLARARELADPALWELQRRLTDQWSRGACDVPRLASEIADLLAAAGKEPDQRRARLRQLLTLVGQEWRRELASVADCSRDVDALLATLERTIEAELHLDRNANQNLLVECWLDDVARLASAAPKSDSTA